MIALDTNILVYAEQDDHSDRRRDIAVELITQLTLSGAIIPVQVQAEFVNVCIRKGNMPPERAVAIVSLYQAVFDTPATIASDIVDAAVLAGRYQLAWFDALICAVARRAGASILLSEDMADGADLDGLCIVNPFEMRNAELLATKIATLQS